MQRKPHRSRSFSSIWVERILLYLWGLGVLVSVGLLGQIIHLDTQSLGMAFQYLPMWLQTENGWAYVFLALPLMVIGWRRLMITMLKDQYFSMFRLDHVDEMEGSYFEQYVARLLRYMGYNAQVTGGASDFGVDVVAQKDNHRYAVQVKRYQGRVSRRAVSDAVGGMQHYGCNRCMVVTNSYFTNDAIRLANTNNCVLVDRDDLAGWIRSYRTGLPASVNIARFVSIGAWVANFGALTFMLACLYSLVNILLPFTNVSVGSVSAERQHMNETPVPTLSVAPNVANGPPRATFEQVWVEQDVIDQTENGAIGAKIHTKFSLENSKDVPMVLILQFLDAQRKPITLSNNLASIDRAFQATQQTRYTVEGTVFVPYVQFGNAAQTNKQGYVRATLVTSQQRNVIATAQELALRFK